MWKWCWLLINAVWESLQSGSATAPGLADPQKLPFHVLIFPFFTFPILQKESNAVPVCSRPKLAAEGGGLCQQRCLALEELSMMTSQRRDDAADAIDSRWEMNDLPWGIIHMATFGRPSRKQSMSVRDEKKVVMMRGPIWLSSSSGREASNRMMQIFCREGSASTMDDNVVETWARSNHWSLNSGSSTAAM